VGLYLFRCIFLKRSPDILQPSSFEADKEQYFCGFYVTDCFDLESRRCGVYVSDVDRRVNHDRRRSFDRRRSYVSPCCCTSWVAGYVVANCRLQHKPSHHPLVIAVLTLAILQISATLSHLRILPHPANLCYCLYTILTTTVYLSVIMKLSIALLALTTASVSAFAPCTRSTVFLKRRCVIFRWMLRTFLHLISWSFISPAVWSL